MGIGKVLLFAQLTNQPGWEPSGSLSNRKCGEEATVPPLHVPATDGAAGL